MENKKPNTKNAVKAGIWYTISSVTVKTITIIMTPIFTRMMTTSEYGLASTFISWYTLLLVFATLNLTYSIGRAKLDFPGKLTEYVGSMQLLSSIATLCLCIVAAIFIEPVAQILELNIPLVILLMIYLFFAPAITFTQSRFRYEYRYKGNIFISAYTTVSAVVVTLIFLFIFKEDRYYAKVLGSVLPAVILSLVFWYQAAKSKSLKVNTTYWKYGLSIGLPLIFHTVSLNILAQSDRIMITKFCGENFTGIYSLAYNFSIMINVILHAVNEAWLPWFHDTYFAEDFKAIRQNVKPLVILGSMLGIGCVAIAPELMMILGPSSYHSGQWVVGPITVGLVCQFIYQQYVHIELHLKKTNFISLGTVTAAVLNLILNAIFIPKYGFIAAAYTTMGCYFVLMAMHLFITRKLLKVHLYHDSFMIAAILIVVVICGGFMLLYSTIAIRYVLLTALCILYLVTNKKYILGYLNSRKKKSKQGN